ncbi:MAG: SAM-dependent methyltransferase [bacterium]|nr:SAM-dependent methyltransferase [bacterium]
MKKNNLAELINAAFQARTDLVKRLETENTDTWRLFHGVNEGCPGVTIDRYGGQILIQGFHRLLSPAEIDEIKSAVTGHLGFAPFFVYNDRGGKGIKNIPLGNKTDDENAGKPSVCMESGVKYRVTGVHRGLDPLLFLDLRAVRRFVMQHCKSKSLLNLFAYTCGAGVAAAAAGADEVWNVDFAQSALDFGKENAGLNHIPAERIRFIREDVFPVIRQLSGLGVKGKARRRPFRRFKPRTFDIVFMDPPTWAKSPFGAVDIIGDYQGLFKPALLCTAPGGTIICTNHAPSVELDNWLNLLKRCAEKAGRHIKEIRVLEPEPDFPSPDGKHPLKIAALVII